MKFISQILLGLMITSLVSSCQDVIVLDLDEIPPQLVIEGSITDQPGPYTVKITQSAKFYDPNNYPNVSNAKVTITDDVGNEDVLTEESAGVYQTTSIQGMRGRTYTLRVEVDGEVYQASSTMPAQYVNLDSVSIEFKEESIFEQEGYYFTIYFNDPADAENYYRLLVNVNGAPFIFNQDDDEEENRYEDNNLWLTSDKYTNGNLQDIELPHNLSLGDSLSLEMLHIDKSSYDFYRTLNDVIESQGVAPSNPISNFEDKALGYFGAFSVSKLNTIIE